MKSIRKWHNCRNSRKLLLLVFRIMRCCIQRFMFAVSKSCVQTSRKVNTEQFMVELNDNTCFNVGFFWFSCGKYDEIEFCSTFYLSRELTKKRERDSMITFITLDEFNVINVNSLSLSSTWSIWGLVSKDEKRFWNSTIRK